MKHLRDLVPILSLFALVALFLTLPETPDFFGIFKCKTCTSNNPYFALIGAAYFSLLLALSLLFPGFPSAIVAQSGLIWAICLGFALTIVLWPELCVLCLFCHTCHILIWFIWTVSSVNVYEPTVSFRERLYLALFAPISIVALFACLNLTFMVYNLKTTQKTIVKGLQKGDEAPASAFAASNARENYMINFISPHCPYCLEQLASLDKVFKEHNESVKIITVIPNLPHHLATDYASFEWLGDETGELRKLYKISGYPTLIIIGNDNKILRVFSGINEGFKNDLVEIFDQLKEPK